MVRSNLIPLQADLKQADSVPNLKGGELGSINADLSRIPDLETRGFLEELFVAFLWTYQGEPALVEERIFRLRFEWGKHRVGSYRHDVGILALGSLL